MKALVFVFLVLHSLTGTITQNVQNGSWRTGIMGGKNVSITQSPYVLAVITEEEFFLGTAALLNNKWAITAAYTVDGQTDVQIRAGSSNAEEGGTIYNVSKIVTHPNYTGDWRYDIALLRLEIPIRFNIKTKPISLAKALPTPGTKSTVTGYGSQTYSQLPDGILRQAVVPYIPYTTCQTKYNNTQASFTSLSFCASRNGIGPCPMDFGAPLVTRNKLYGIFSGSYYECGSDSYPAVYADLTQFTDWIKNHTKK